MSVELSKKNEQGPLKPQIIAPALTGQESEESQSEGTVELIKQAADRVVDSIHQVHGNGMVEQALAGVELGGWGALISSELTLATAGIETGGGPGQGSNRAMMRIMRHAQGVDEARAMNSIKTGGGRALPAVHLSRFEQAFGHSLSHVTIHDDAMAANAADALNAYAFALGSHIYFGTGGFAPGSTKGDRLLAHELTHVIQHDEGRLPTATGSGLDVSNPSDPAELEAYANEDRILDKLPSASSVAETPSPSGGGGEESSIGVSSDMSMGGGAGLSDTVGVDVDVDVGAEVSSFDMGESAMAGGAAMGVESSVGSGIEGPSMSAAGEGSALRREKGGSKGGDAGETKAAIQEALGVAKTLVESATTTAQAKQADEATEQSPESQGETSAGQAPAVASEAQGEGEEGAETKVIEEASGPEVDAIQDAAAQIEASLAETDAVLEESGGDVGGGASTEKRSSSSTSERSSGSRGAGSRGKSEGSSAGAKSSATKKSKGKNAGEIQELEEKIEVLEAQKAHLEEMVEGLQGLLDARATQLAAEAAAEGGEATGVDSDSGSQSLIAQKESLSSKISAINEKISALESKKSDLEKEDKESEKAGKGKSASKSKKAGKGKSASKSKKAGKGKSANKTRKNRKTR